MHVKCLELGLSHTKHSNGNIIIIKIIVFFPNSASHPKIAR